MIPYFQRDGITLYHGDAREIVPTLPLVDAVITDPVWPNALPSLAGADDPVALFAEVATHFPAIARRLVVQLGCDSDPRFLAAVPSVMPYLRTCWLEYVRPHYKGRLLYTSDIAYVFGAWPEGRLGGSVLPGKISQTDAAKRPKGHPCPRQLQHVKWLVKWFARGIVLDPFAGIGTTLVAAHQAGIPAIGIEIEEAYCAAAVERLAQRAMSLEVLT